MSADDDFAGQMGLPLKLKLDGHNDFLVIEMRLKDDVVIIAMFYF